MVNVFSNGIIKNSLVFISKDFITGTWILLTSQQCTVYAQQVKRLLYRFVSHL
jgi:hypothetical protein